MSLENSKHRKGVIQSPQALTATAQDRALNHLEKLLFAKRVTPKQYSLTSFGEVACRWESRPAVQENTKR